MDITLIKTFLEVAATGSFVSASDRLFVTQSAVSLRIQRLEDSLGRALFSRSKAGAVLTPAGAEFENYALSMIKLWQEARQQVAIPEGYNRSLTIGAQYSLWPRLGFRWLDALQHNMPDLSLRAELGMPDRLTRFLIEGVIQAALMYTPQLRPGLEAEELLDDELVMVASYPDPDFERISDHYVFVDWGPEFVQAHAMALPSLLNPGITLSLGAMAAQYILRRKAAAYVPVRSVVPSIDSGELHLVPDAPRFPYPVWAIWREDIEPELKMSAKAALKQVVDDAEEAQGEIIDQLAEISDDNEVEILGEEANILDKQKLP
ncbi:LysR family transcriptional regulator [uncultured Tateyamaria sp.]|uniref:LysR family transcriptional regulator n=1 Tax=uncultured Tateyamaria sp. TaxID=455651 RepID=UPI00260F38BD|nr:LysR family transcriptional regulator [uncultured Tateyamaria sp.]